MKTYELLSLLLYSLNNLFVDIENLSDSYIIGTDPESPVLPFRCRSAPSPELRLLPRAAADAVVCTTQDVIGAGARHGITSAAHDAATVIGDAIGGWIECTYSSSCLGKQELQGVCSWSVLGYSEA